MKRLKTIPKKVKPYNSPVRVSSELMSKINYIKAIYLSQGKNPPSTAKATYIIGKILTKEVIIKNLMN